MRKIFILIPIFFLVSVSAFTFDSSIYNDFGIVSIYSRQLVVQSADMLVLWDDLGTPGETDLAISADIGVFHSILLQNQAWHLDFNDSYYLTAQFDSTGDGLEQGSVGTSIDFDVSRYIGQMPVFVTAGSSVSLDLTYPLEPVIEPGWSLGGGAGRKIPVHPVAVVLAIIKELNSDISETQIIEAAKIIAKEAEYYYLNPGKGDEVFFGDLAEILEAEAMQVQRAMRNTAAVSQRYTGYSVLAEYLQSLDSDSGELTVPALHFSAEKYMPVTMPLYLEPGLNFYIFLPSGSEAFWYLGLDTLIALDISSNWSLSFTGAAWMDNNLDFYFGFYAGSKTRIFDRLYLDIDLNNAVNLPGPVADVNLDIGLTWYIF